MRRPKAILCYAQERDGVWEAICVDFDIAVQASSFEELKQSLSTAIRLYVEAANAEDPATRARLLSRRAPLKVRMAWLLRFLRAGLWRRDSGSDSTAEILLPCPA